MSTLFVTLDPRGRGVELRGRGVNAVYPVNGYLVASVNTDVAGSVDISLPGSDVLLSQVPVVSCLNGTTGLKIGADASSTASNLNTLFFDAEKFPYLGDLQNVSAASPNSGDVLVFDGGTWTTGAPSGGATASTDLTDSADLIRVTNSLGDLASSQSTQLSDSADLIRTTNTVSDLNFLLAPSAVGHVPMYLGSNLWGITTTLASIGISDGTNTCALDVNGNVVEFTSSDGSVTITSDGINNEVDFVASGGGGAKYTFHDAGRRQWGSTQSNHYHVGDITYGMYDNVENFASSSISGTNTFDFYMINAWPMPVAATDIKLTGFVAPLSSGLVSQDLDVMLYRMRWTGGDDSAISLIHTESVTTSSAVGFATDISFTTTTTDINEGDLLQIVYRFPTVTMTATSYLNYTTTLVVS